MPKSASSNTQKARIFISYKSNVEPDDLVATKVHKVLEEHHEVFIDKDMEIGERWAERIEEELRRSDYLIIFLSAESVHSEMVLGEVETAHRLAKEQGGRPRIMPVRLDYREPFKYPLSAYLNPLNWAFWESPDDTPQLIEELQRAITGQDLAIATTAAKDNLVQPSVGLETPGGAMSPQSEFYVKRNSDRIAISAIERQSGVTITLKGPRQVGKSSLLRRVMDAAKHAGKRVVYVDFSLFDRSDFENVNVFHRQFCTWITVELELEDEVDQRWRDNLGNSQNCTRYVSRYLLRNIEQPLVLVLDKVERLFKTHFSSDFFGMLRNWHNRRGAGSVWEQLDLVLVSSTEPKHFIKDLQQSPFNVGEVVTFEDFTKEQVADLNRRYNAPLTRDQEQQLITLVGGHPYLVRRALYLVASGRWRASDLFAQAADDHGPFGDHLRYYWFQLHGQEELIRGLHQVLRHKKCQDEMVCYRLEGAGLVRSARGLYQPRCQVYADYFEGRLNG